MIKDVIMNRKLGAFELLLVDIPFEFFVQLSPMRALLAAVLCGAFYAAKVKFKGEFSLKDLIKFLGSSAKQTDSNNKS